jgi:signal transduction histidine kinase
MYKTFHGNEDARGIGLFITKNQIEAIGGKIEVQSVVDRGTVFTISFKYEKK